MARISTKRPSKKPAKHEYPPDQIRVRMYRTGIGECFLLTFPRLGVPSHMLINCGMLMGTPGAEERMRNVARDIQNETSGGLDVLVATHPHWDKVSGFVQAKSVFDDMSVGQVWLGWTEDPNDPQAEMLRRKRGMSGSKTASAIEYVRTIGQRVYYCRGGEGPLALSGVAGVRVFFLGPPPFDADPGRAQSAIEATRSVTASPFSESYRISREAAKNHPDFAVYFGKTGLSNRDSSEDAGWRQIGVRSLTSIPRLSLGNPQTVNDTSVAFAIELVVPRRESKVLLFPGDAQLASWFSWHGHRWPPGSGPNDPQAITCRQLLERTVLYKVSHYGSRNGTPRQFGLEMMTNPELVAMLAVDRPVAERRRWQLPAPEILAALDRKTRGRVIRSDLDSGVAAMENSALNATENEQFQKALHAADLYIDYFVSIPQLTAAERQQSIANWDSANQRRVYLIDKKLAGTIKPEEEAELRELEKLMDEYLSTSAPSSVGLLAELRDTGRGAKGPAKR